MATCPERSPNIAPRTPSPRRDHRLLNSHLRSEEAIGRTTSLAAPPLVLVFRPGFGWARGAPIRGVRLIRGCQWWRGSRIPVLTDVPRVSGFCSTADRALRVRALEERGAERQGPCASCAWRLEWTAGVDLSLQSVTTCLPKQTVSAPRPRGLTDPPVV